MLLRLLPELDGQATNRRTVSRSEHDCPLHLEAVERDRYTQTVRLTYEFTDESGVRRQPALWVRLYRDASVAEASSGRAHVCSPVTNAPLVCGLMLEKKN